MNTLIFPVNNSGLLKLSQEAAGGPVILSGNNGQTIIPAGEMVQLCNLYRYVKRSDVSDDFINPQGRRWKFSGGLRPVPDLPRETPETTEAPEAQEEQPLVYWFFLYEDGDGGVHILRRPLSLGDDSTAAQLDIIERYRDRGGALLASWPAVQVVELADLDAPAPSADAAPAPEGGPEAP